MLFVAIVGTPGQVVWGKSCGVTWNMEGRRKRGQHMARWRAGPLYHIPAVYWNLNPALSRGKPKHLSQHLRIRPVAPATSTFSISGASCIVLRPLDEPSVLSYGRGGTVGEGDAANPNSCSVFFLTLSSYLYPGYSTAKPPP